MSLQAIVKEAFTLVRPIILIDDPERENEGDLVIPASIITEEMLLFFLRHSTGQICIACSAERLAELQIPLMSTFNTDPNRTAFCISVDLASKHGITTGVSAAERVKTIRALANKEYGAADFTRPGHVFPLREHPFGLKARRGHTEGSVELCRIAGYEPVAVIVELMNTVGEMMRAAECQLFAQQQNGLTIINMQQLILYKLLPAATIQDQPLQQGVKGAALPIILQNGQTLNCSIATFTDYQCTYVVVMKGVVQEFDIPLRIHSECLTGDVFGSARCDCGTQLQQYLQIMHASLAALLIYVQGHEGRGIGLPAKIAAYQLQDAGKCDTLDANLLIGCPVDTRSYDKILAILQQMGIKTVHLYTQNPEKMTAIASMISRVTACPGQTTSHNQKYLETKSTRLFVPCTRPLIGIVYTTTWHQKHIQCMVRQCKTFFEQSGVPVREQAVSGAFELVMGARALIRKGCKAVIAIAILLQGDTYHFEIVANGVTTGLMQMQLQEGIPVILGVLACKTQAQIEERVLGEKNTIQQWCEAALEMTQLEITTTIKTS